MAVTAFWFGRSLEGQWGTTADRRIDWVTDTIQCSLHTVAYVPDRDANDFFNDATNELATAGGYTAGGVVLGTKSVAYDTGTNETRLDAADAEWTSATFTARISVVWKNTAGAASTDPLISFVDFGGDESVASGTFRIQWDATGVAKVTS